jgi:hypothetical protein
MILQAAALLGEQPRAEKILVGCEEGRSLVWTAGRKARVLPEQVAVGVVRFENAERARAYYGLAIDLRRKQDELLGPSCGNGCRIHSSKSTTIPLAGAEEAVQIDKQLQFASSGPTTIPVSVLLVRSGALVLEFTWQEVPIDVAWAAKALATIRADAGPR